MKFEFTSAGGGSGFFGVAFRFRCICPSGYFFNLDQCSRAPPGGFVVVVVVVVVDVDVDVVVVDDVVDVDDDDDDGGCI